MTGAEWITVPEAAAMLGVSRQRVLQACHADYAIRRTDDILPHRDTTPDAKRRSLVVSAAAVLAWRLQRAAQNEPVGPLPAAFAELDTFPPPVPELPPMPRVVGIGLATFRPF